MLACGSTALLDLSGDLVKTRCAQTLTNPYPDKPPLLVSTKGDLGAASELCVRIYLLFYISL